MNNKDDIKVDFSELRELLNKIIDDAEKKEKEQKPKSEIDILKARISNLENRISIIESNWYLYNQPYINPGPCTVPLPYITFKPNTGDGWTTIPKDSITFGSTDQKPDQIIRSEHFLTGSTKAVISGSESQSRE